MKIAIRVDASLWIGSGHVMRCLVLADELVARKHNVTFYCQSFPGDLIGYIESKGFEVVKLDTSEKRHIDIWSGDYSSWLKRTVKEDADSFLTVTGEHDWIITNHYEVGFEWHGYVREKTKTKILAIDDLNRSHQADIVLDQNYWSDLESRYLDYNCIRLLGPKYALLRSSFNKLRREAKKESNTVLAFFGGSDLTNECEKLLKARLHFTTLPFELKVISGRQNPRVSDLKQLGEKSGVSVVSYLDDFDSCLFQASYVIGASGVSNWERFCLHVPATVVSVANNQIELSEHLSSLGLVRYIGSSNDTTIESYIREIEYLCGKPWLSPGPVLEVDGLGAKRVVTRIEEVL